MPVWLICKHVCICCMHIMYTHLSLRYLFEIYIQVHIQVHAYYQELGRYFGGKEPWIRGLGRSVDSGPKKDIIHFIWAILMKK